MKLLQQSCQIPCKWVRVCTFLDYNVPEYGEPENTGDAMGAGLHVTAMSHSPPGPDPVEALIEDICPKHREALSGNTPKVMGMFLRMLDLLSNLGSF
jgi:hypothetical protein